MTIPKWNEAELAEAIAGGVTLLIDLQADWCVQCGPQERVLERIAPEYEGRVWLASIDVGLHPSIVDEYEISGLPAMLLFREGVHAETLCGFQRALPLRLALNKLLEPA